MSSEPSKEYFMELVTQHQQRVFGYIYALVHNMEDAQDLHQQTLMVLWRKFGQYTPGTNFLAWATKIAQLEVFAFHKSRPVGQVSLSAEALANVAESQVRQTLDPQADSNRLQALLENCIEKLAEIDRELLDRCYRLCCRIKDVAAQLGRSSQSICNSLRRIRRELLKCVDRALSEDQDR